MKKILCSFCVLLMLSAQAQTWKPLGDPGFSSGNAMTTSMAVDRYGTPYIAYQDGFGGRATVMKFDGSSWVAVGTPGFSAGAAYNTSLALDTNGVPYIAYEDGGNGNKATVMKFNGTNWVAVGKAGFSAAGVQYTSIAVDGNCTLYVVYQDGDSAKNKATVMRYDINSNTWVPVGKRKFSRADVYYTSIAVDFWGTPYVVYEDGSYGSATVMQFDGNNWIPVGIPSFSAGRVAYTTIALGWDGNPCVAYSDGGNASKATVMAFDWGNNKWVNVGQAGFSAGQAEYTSIARDNFGVIYVAYADNSDSDKATVMRFYNDWETVGSRGFSSQWAWTTSLAIDGNGIPYVGYSDLGYDYKAAVMKLDQGTTAVKNVTNSVAASLAVFPNPNRGAFTLSISSPKNEEATITITNILGAKVKELNAVTNRNAQIQIDGPPGVYFISAVTNKERVTGKIVLE